MKRKFLALMIAVVLLAPQGQMITANAQGENNQFVVQSQIAKSSVNIIVDGNMKGDSGQTIDGVKTVKTVKEAIDLVPDNNTQEFVIFIKSGTYKEKLYINKPNITLVGQSNTKTVLTYDDAAGTIKRVEDNGDETKTYGTGGSPSVNIGGNAKNFSAVNLTMENSFDEVENSSMKSKQAVAMMSVADMTTFVNCRFIGNQDTLCPYNNRQYYKNCYIEGDVDFVFSNAQAVFEGCELHSVYRNGISPKGYVTEPNTSADSEYGYLFENCNLTSDIKDAGSVYLGRPWHDNGTRNSEAVFKNCKIGAHINVEGWSTMEGRDASGNKEMEYPENNRMYEYGSTGTGAVNTSTKNRKILTDAESSKYTKANVLNNWNADSVADKLVAYEKEAETLKSAETQSKENLAEKVKWNFTRFGLTTSEDQNTVLVYDKNKTVTLTSGQPDGSRAGGKITGSNDGISYYYTEINPDENFELSADVKVNYFEKTKPDKQCGFGIMARDTLLEPNDDSIAPSNMVLVGGYKAAVQSVMRYGVTADNSSKIVMENPHQFAGRPANDGTTTYKLKLKKTNTGYIASVNDGEEVTYFRPEGLEVMDSGKVYLGFFTARVAGITVSNINLSKSNEKDDAPRMPAPEVKIDPSVKMSSTKTSGSENYKVAVDTNVSGKLDVVQDGKDIYSGKVANGKTLNIDTKLKKGTNNFVIKYTSEDGTEIKTTTANVDYKSYGTENGEIYVSQEGTENGDGSIEKPLDIYTALKYTNNGQTIKVKGGTYKLRDTLSIDKGNDGTKNNMKTLTSYDGNAVFDFGKEAVGARFAGNYWSIKNIEVCNSKDAESGLVVSGSNNVFEGVKTYKNGDSGFQIAGSLYDTFDKWPANNLVLNCESYDNMDAAMNNADGFAAKISIGEGNVFRGCISHNNCDDGWDLFSKLEIGKIGAVLIEDCITYGNGTLSDGTVTKGDGNGFKLGGEGIPVKHRLRNSLSFNNNEVGILSNQNPACIVENSVSVDNNINVKLDNYKSVKPQYKMSNVISFMTNGGKADIIPDEVKSDYNYFFNGSETANINGEKLTKDDFKSTEMPSGIKRDNRGNIIRGDYMVLKDKSSKDPGKIDIGYKGQASKDNGDEVFAPNKDKAKGSNLASSNNEKTSLNKGQSTSAKTGDMGVITALIAGVSMFVTAIFRRKRK